MGPISQTADRLGLSVRERAMIAASVVNALGQDVDETNINRSSAWEKAKKERIKKSEIIKSEYLAPQNLAVHWDGKILKVKGNKTSNRVCVYVTGTDAKGERKLLGVLENESGTGEAELR